MDTILSTDILLTLLVALLIVVPVAYVAIDYQLTKDDVPEFMPSGYQLPPYITFEDASAKYLEKYGKPDDTTSYYSDGYSSVTWYYNTGLVIEFVNSDANPVFGWAMESIMIIE